MATVVFHEVDVENAICKTQQILEVDIGRQIQTR
jgi:hypothetical protein